jgi:hypothetical protein
MRDRRPPEIEQVGPSRPGLAEVLYALDPVRVRPC